MPAPSFREFAERKTAEAEGALIPPMRTLAAGQHAATLRAIGNDWTRARFDGPFHLFDPPTSVPAISLTFVQSVEGNTVTDDPADLGGGAIDKHLIYEGLSRVAADAVLAGARTVMGSAVFFSVWHPEIVSLRRDLGLPRHPAQVVISNSGRLDLDALLFNVPDVRVFVIAGERCRERCATVSADRPWITLVPLTSGGLADACARLRREHQLSRISAIGGHSTATALIDAGLVQDLCLTTTARRAGEPHTPFYSGQHPLTTDLIIRKEGRADDGPIVFEHLRLLPITPSHLSVTSAL